MATITTSSSSTSSSTTTTTSMGASGIDLKTRQDLFRLQDCASKGKFQFECKILPANSITYRYQQMGMGFGNPNFPLWTTSLDVATTSGILQKTIIVQYKNKRPLELFHLSNNNLIKLLTSESQSDNQKDIDFINSIIELEEVTEKMLNYIYGGLKNFLQSVKEQRKDSSIKAILEHTGIPSTNYLIAQLKDVALPYNSKLYKNQQLVNVIHKYGFDGWVALPNLVDQIMMNEHEMYQSEILIANPSGIMEAKIYRQANAQRMKNLGAIGPNYKLPYMINLRKRRNSNIRKTPEVPMGLIYNTAKMPIQNNLKQKPGNAILEMLKIAILKEYNRSGKVYPEYFGIFKFPETKEYAELNFEYDQMRIIIQNTLRKKQPPPTNKNTYANLSNAPFTPMNSSPSNLTHSDILSVVKNPQAYLQYLKSTEKINTELNTSPPQKSILVNKNYQLKMPSNLNILTTSSKTVKRNKEIPIFSLQRQNQRKTRKNRK